ncbi:MAG TPA: ATP-binding protein [Burkholderiales bacterium]|nr:ATP-binding protein [Burkholderiales bacterium]
MIGRVARTLLALVLVGVLAFLYVMSQGGDLKRQTQIVTDLRNLKEIDTRWNRDIAAARSDAVNAEPRARDPIARLQPLLEDLGSETAALKNPALATGVEGLRSAVLEKQKLMDQFDQVRAQLRATLRDLLAQLSGMRQTAARLAEVEAKQRQKLSALEGQLVALNAELLRLYVQPDDNARKAVEGATANLVQSADQYPEAVRTPLSGLAQTVTVLLKQEPGATQLAEQLARLPTAPRITSLNDAFDREFQTIGEQKELFRVYVFFYSLALLVFLGYVLWQLGRSNVKINHANEALKAANENLEHKVQDRTKELSEALKHLKESELMLVQTEKMSSLGQMVAGIAHEINTPLAYVKASLASVKERLPHVESLVAECGKLLAMLERGDVPDAELSAQFTRVSTLSAKFRAESDAADLAHLTNDGLHGIDQISEIVVNLKNFSRLDRSKLQRFNLNEGIESTLVIARNMVKHKTVHKQLGEIPLVECSPSQVNQVFLNLVTNAAQATDDVSGEITVATALTQSGHVRIDVSDNGHGIPQAILSKIFDPFFTTKDVGQGTGLGLSIAYKIVQEHGGRIEVKSTVGKGTTFSVFLPVKAVQPQALAA